MYKIKIVCLDPPYSDPPYTDEVKSEFEYREDAKLALLECVIDEAKTLNEPDAHNTPRTNIFVICRDQEIGGKKYDAAIVMWDGATGIDGQLITGYYIEWVNSNSVDQYNRKLRDRHGDRITVKIQSEMGLTSDEEEDDNDVEEHEVYFYTSARYGDCDTRYATAEEAYNAANDYLNNLYY